MDDVVGIVGHRDLTSNRGQGDPGDAIMSALWKVGCQRLSFECYEDIIVWKQRQAVLGVAYLDGIPGPHTVELLKRAGHKDGLWGSLNA